MVRKLVQAGVPAHFKRNQIVINAVQAGVRARNIPAVGTAARILQRMTGGIRLVVVIPTAAAYSQWRVLLCVGRACRSGSRR